MVSEDVGLWQQSDAERLQTPEDAERYAQSRQYSSLPEGTTVVDRGEAPVESFMVELERQMLTGHSAVARRQWAKTQGVDRTSVARFEEIIRGTWTVEATTHYALQQRRDALRAMYGQIFYQAMNPGEVVTKNGEIVQGSPDLMVALKTVDSMAKLDGLAIPDVAIFSANGGAERQDQTKVQLTNKTRERTMDLLRLARERAERHAAKTTRALQEPVETESFEVPSQKVIGVVR